ncbi:hypothetical protein D3C85_1738520 [compost metagenome]
MDGEDSNSIIAAANASASPTGTSFPHLPFSRISAGPLGQSVETTEAPQAMASINAFGSPSRADDKANTETLLIQE